MLLLRSIGVLRRDAVFYLVALTLVLALILGGGTRGGFLSDVLLQILSVPLLLIALWQLAEADGTVSRWALVFCAALAALPLLQVIPLPPAVWTALAHRQDEMNALRLAASGDLPWMPLSVAPSATWLSALSLIVPLAIFCGVLLLDAPQRRKLTLVLLSTGLVAVLIGLLQVAQGPGSDLRFFDFSNPSEAVGFFANRNHYSALLYSLMLFAAAWSVDATLKAGAQPPGSRFQTGIALAVLASFTCLVVLIGAQAMARSRAGLALAIVALFGAVVLHLADGRQGAAGARVTPGKLLLAACALAGIFATQFALYRIMERFTADPLQDARLAFGRNTIAAAKAYMPFGAGLGTFVPVYAEWEPAADMLANTFANRAHNDFLELWLESGIFGLAAHGRLCRLVCHPRAYRLWRHSAPSTAPIDVLLARAATLTVALIVVHSLFDYPLRTAAMMGVFAVACALMFEPAKSANTASAEAARQHQYAAPTRAPQNAPFFPQAEMPKADSWGREVQWPQAWQPQRGRNENDV